MFFCRKKMHVRIYGKQTKNNLLSEFFSFSICRITIYIIWHVIEGRKLLIVRLRRQIVNVSKFYFGLQIFSVTQWFTLLFLIFTTASLVFAPCSLLRREKTRPSCWKSCRNFSILTNQTINQETKNQKRFVHRFSAEISLPSPPHTSFLSYSTTPTSQPITSPQAPAPWSRLYLPRGAERRKKKEAKQAASPPAL